MGKIVVIGDVMIDIYVHGGIDRISPEAPVPILNKTNTIYVAGGAANVARNIVALGNECTLISVLGHGPNRSKLWDSICENGIEAFMFSEENRLITEKTRYMSNGSQILRVDSENVHTISDISADSIVSCLERRIAEDQCDLIVISDYNKGVLSPYLISSVMKIAYKNDIKVLVDTKKTDISLYGGAYLLTPNDKERLLLKADPLSFIENVLVTRGSEGMTLYTPNYELDVDAISKNAVDVSGAGDTVLATMASELAKKTPIIRATKLANLAASIVVNKQGTAVCTQQELTHAVARGNLKHYTTDSLLDKADEWARRKKTVGFINGCFDMLHAGHLHLIREAKKHCDKLIIAVNSNETVTKLKGSGRPINLERHKALAAIKEVDAVVQFDEETPKRLIELIAPCIHFVGSDYTEEQVRQVSCAEAIVRIPHLNPNFSTSEILK